MMDYYEKRDYYPETDGVKKPIDFKKSEIRQLFNGANIFITGGAGFLGCLLIEKIARSCPDFGKIYLLLRPKRGLTASQRLEKLFEDEIYNTIRKDNPDFISRVFLMEGDLADSICGLSEENQNIIREEVDFVYHIAACLRMTEPLKSAYYMNIQATKDLLDLGTEMKRLKGFVYISTAYSNCFRPDISETFYPTTYNWEELRDLVERMSEEELSYFTPKGSMTGTTCHRITTGSFYIPKNGLDAYVLPGLTGLSTLLLFHRKCNISLDPTDQDVGNKLLLGPWVNTYAFTKAVSEDMIQSYVGKIPVAIARPSIVIGCVEEPLRGWINNVYGAVGVSAGACVGLIRVWYADEDKIADIIPADYVVNTMIAIAWQLAKNQRNKIHNQYPIYNIVSSPKAPTTWGEYMRLSFKSAYESKVTTRKTMGEYSLMLIHRRWLFFTLFYILHLTQSFLVDSLLFFNGKPALVMKGYIKILRFNLQLAFFCERQWEYEQNNVDCLWNTLPEVDKAIFPFDMANFSWPEYHSYSIRAILKYIVKSKDSEQPKLARERYIRFMRIRQWITRVLLLVVGWNTITCFNRTVIPMVSALF